MGRRGAALRRTDGCWQSLRACVGSLEAHDVWWMGGLQVQQGGGMGAGPGQTYSLWCQMEQGLRSTRVCSCKQLGVGERYAGGERENSGGGRAEEPYEGRWVGLSMKFDYAK